MSSLDCPLEFNEKEDIKLLLHSFCSTNAIILCFKKDAINNYKKIINHKAVQEILTDAELLKAINILFESELNVSVAAIKAYMHRNTLSYRLDKLKEKLGLDLRKFSDAVIFNNVLTIKEIVAVDK